MDRVRWTAHPVMYNIELPVDSDWLSSPPLAPPSACPGPAHQRLPPSHVDQLSTAAGRYDWPHRVPSWELTVNYRFLALVGSNNSVVGGGVHVHNKGARCSVSRRVYYRTLVELRVQASRPRCYKSSAATHCSVHQHPQRALRQVMTWVSVSAGLMACIYN